MAAEPTVEDTPSERPGSRVARDDDVLEEAAELRAAGLSLVNLGDQHGIDVQAVANRCRRRRVSRCDLDEVGAPEVTSTRPVIQ